MMGHRGCRLAVTYPGDRRRCRPAPSSALPSTSRSAIAEWNDQVPEIMIPLVGEVKELKYVKDVVVETADELIAASGVDMKYQVGTMIEIPQRRSDRRRDRQGSRVLLLRHQRPDPDDLRLQP